MGVLSDRQATLGVTGSSRPRVHYEFFLESLLIRVKRVYRDLYFISFYLRGGLYSFKLSVYFVGRGKSNI